MKWMEQILEKVAENGPLEPGEMFAYVLNDAIVVGEMDEQRVVSVKIVAGEPEHLDITIGCCEVDADA